MMRGAPKGVDSDNANASGLRDVTALSGNGELVRNVEA